MIQMESKLQVADNTGARVAKMIGVLGKRTRSAGVGDITSGKLYKAGELAETATLLQNGSIKSKKDSTNAVTWANTYKGGKHVYTSLGVPSDFEDPDFVRLLENAIFFTTGKQAANYTR